MTFITREGYKYFIGSSGGNAGMAMAVAARKIGKKVKIFIPTSTLPFMVEKLKLEGAEVVVTGTNWNEANDAAQAELSSQPGAFMVHPFNQPSTWSGHASLVAELLSQLEERPACLLSCVGGGGLALGLLQGLQTAGWTQSVPLVTMETAGANCLLASRTAGHSVTLPRISSQATSLGALTVAGALLELCLSQPERVISHQVEDEAALAACLQFADDHRMMVEPACGAALSAIYSGLLPSILDTISKPGPVVVIVCGGNIVNTELLSMWKHQLGV